MLCKILIINMLDYKFKRFIFNKTLKFVFRLQIANSLNAKDLLFADKNKAIGKWH